MATITIEVTDTELAALTWCCYDVTEWCDNLMTERANRAINEIVQLAVQKYIDAGENIPGDKSIIVSEAFTRGWIRTAKDVTDNSTPGV